LRPQKENIPRHSKEIDNDCRESYGTGVRRRNAMKSIREFRNPEYDVDPVFLNRWSPRAMSGEGIGRKELLSLFEAARWAPSANNNQPWRFVYAMRDTN
jgi:hypothetical protein